MLRPPCAAGCISDVRIEMRDILLVPIRATERSFAASLFDAANRRDAAAPEAGPVAVKDCSGADAASLATATAAHPTSQADLVTGFGRT